MTRSVVTMLVALAFCLSACGTPEGDLNDFCTIVEEVMADDSKKGKRDIAIFKRVSMNLSTAEAKDLLMSLPKTKPKKRYKKLVKGAKKLGIKGYKCSAAKKWFKSQKK